MPKDWFTYDKLDWQDPFVRLIRWSVAVTIASIFFVRYAVESVVPGLGRPLFIPFAMALFCGTLAFLTERARGRYVLAILGFLAAMVIFPLLAWALLHLLHIPYQTRDADFIALIPQAVAGPSFFEFIRRRFEGGKVTERAASMTD